MMGKLRIRWYHGEAPLPRKPHITRVCNRWLIEDRGWLYYGTSPLNAYHKWQMHQPTARA